MLQSNGRVWGPVNSEDLVDVPGTPWVIASGMRGPTAPLGRLYAIDRRDRSCNEVFPYDADFAAHERYGDSPVLDPADFEPHGIDVGTGPDDTPQVYVVNHGAGVRESVEVFDLHLDGPRPRLTWVGSVTAPAGTWGNDVARLPGGGFLLSSTTDITEGLEKGFARQLAGEETGQVVEWSPDAGWSVVAGSVINSTNGVAASPDGKTVFVAGWKSECIRRIRRSADGAPDVRTVPAGILVDNLTWTADGKLLAAGCFDTTVEQFAAAYWGSQPKVGFPSRVLRIDPDSLEIEVLVEYGPEEFGVATTGLAVGDEIWVGAARDQGIGVFTA
jgi:sugar lactone lactonase YvrE